MAEDHEEKDQEDYSEAETPDDDIDGDDEKRTFVGEKFTNSKFSEHKQGKYESREGGTGR